MPRTVTVDDALRVLNALAEADPVAMGKLTGNRVPFNVAGIKDEAATATVVVGGTPEASTLGIVGILNGIFGAPGEKAPIASIEQDDGSCWSFSSSDAMPPAVDVEPEDEGRQVQTDTP